MAASYPGSVVQFVNKQDFVDVVDAGDINSAYAEISSLETTVGTNPHISSAANPTVTFIAAATTFSSLSARLANVENGVVGDSHSQYVHRSGGDAITPSATSGVGLVFKAVANQTGNHTEWRDANSNLLSAVGADGTLLPGKMILTVLDGTQPGSVIRGSTSQQADLQQWQQSNGTVVGQISSTGALTLQGGLTSQSAAVEGPLTVTGTATLEGAVTVQGTFTAPSPVGSLVSAVIYAPGTISTTGKMGSSYVAPHNLTLTDAEVVVNQGSGLLVSILVNGTQVGSNSGAIDSTTHYSVPVGSVAINTYDRIQLSVVNAGTGVADISATLVFAVR